MERADGREISFIQLIYSVHAVYTVARSTYPTHTHRSHRWLHLHHHWGIGQGVFF